MSAQVLPMPRRPEAVAAEHVVWLLECGRTPRAALADCGLVWMPPDDPTWQDVTAILAAVWTTLPGCPAPFGVPDGARPLARWPLLAHPDAAPLAESQALGGRRA